MDREKISTGIRLILEGIGEDPDREGLVRTPERVAEACEEIFSGLGRSLVEEVRVYGVENHDEMIIVRDIPFYSVCEHHLLPFFGQAHLAYIPRENRITGLSNLVRMLETAARRPQIQERLTSEVCEALVSSLKPLGALVLIEAEHLCMTMRGVQKPGTRIVTSAMRGGFDREATRAEALNLIYGGKH
ncbi:GTP cyclohydrolase I FolE [Gemmatimonadota bacterium]